MTVYIVVEMYKGLINDIRAFDNQSAADEAALLLGTYYEGDDTGPRKFTTEMEKSAI